ncbi:OsmC family protein [Flavobacterium sp. 3HN19-14]|uniref:OsmC family protein n=1 Tax=Flavobacterium sp. 3HN19-14 TaxID=3448133 RepID=UPI003EE2EDA3
MITVLASIQKDNYKTEIKSGSKSIISDEPHDMGGQNLGFTPSELLASSLASCTAITLKMYADRKKWDLAEAMIEVNFENEPRENLSNITMNIRIFGELDEVQRKRLLEIAHNCPIHRILQKPIEIVTHLKD